MLKLVILFVFLTAALGAYDYSGPPAWWDTDDDKEDSKPSNTVPFPQCLISGSRSKYLQSSNLQKLFDRALKDEERNARKEYYENYKKDNHDTMDDDDDDNNSRNNNGNNRAVAAAAIKLTGVVMTKLACDLNGTDSSNLERFLNKFNLPGEFCKFNDKVDCSDKLDFRMPNGLCNNIDHPHEGNSYTAFDRLERADYEDHISEPRQKSVRGGPLPACRKISLALGSKPVFDRSYNHLFVSFGQYISHDTSLSVPVSDTYSTPVTSCTCDKKYDWNKCTVIDIQSDDPYLRGQKCMAFPATAQAFKNEICTLGVKEQLNGNTHFLDLSVLYGSTVRLNEALRGDRGVMKSTRRYGAQCELPPGQREGKSCTDGTLNYNCFAGGDSRLMITLLFTGIQTMFLRAHNIIAKFVITKLPTDHQSDRVYEYTRRLTTAYFQKIIYEEWLPILLGQEVADNNFPKIPPTQFTTYDSDTKPIIFNEFATAAFRLHTLCRDLFSRCTYSGDRIDQLWLNDIVHKAKYAYDIENNCIDSIICGSMYDYGFAFDGNFAYQLHNSLFETTSQYGQTWRNDLIAINICRGREHGIPSYNTFRKHYGLTDAEYFEDLGDTINYEGIQLLKKIYKDVDDIDLFVGLNLEDPVNDGLVGPVSSFIFVEQFRRLRDGDRFFYTHSNNTLTAAQRQFIDELSLSCFVCLTVHIEKVPKNPFVSPANDDDLVTCDSCDSFETLLANMFDADDISSDPVFTDSK